MYKTMIVDDEFNIREGLKTIIDWEDQGFVIVGQACNGMEAMELYRQHKPSLVITDIRMPGMDGFELVKALKEINPNIHIIFLSGYNDFTYAKEAIKYGVSNYLLKPVNTRELCSELADIRKHIDDRLKQQRESQTNRENLKNYFIGKLLRGELLKSEIMDKAPYYGIPVEEGSYCIILAEPANYEDMVLNATENEVQISIFSIKNVLDEILERDDLGLVVENSERQFAVLLTGRHGELDKEAVAGTVLEIHRCIREYTKEELVISAGTVVTSLFDIKASYERAVQSMENSRMNQTAEQGADRNFKDILAYIQQHFNEDINLKKLSELFFMNSIYLGQVFKKETGEYFHDYIHKIRIKRARRLLEEGMLSIGEVAEKVGYKYLDHFYKKYKSLEGCNPGDHKKSPGR